MQGARTPPHARRPDRAAHDGAASAKRALRRILVERAFQLGPIGLADERTGEVTRTISSGVESLDAYVGQYLPQAALAISVPIVVALAVLAVDPLSAVVLCLTYPLIPLFMFLIGGTAEERTRRQWVQLSRLSARFFDAVQGLATLKAFGRSDGEGDAIRRASDRFRELTLRVLRIAFLSALVLELIATLATAIVAVEVGLRLLYGRIAFGNALFVLILAPEFYRPLRTYGAAFHAGMTAREAGTRARELLDKPRPYGAAPIAPAAPGALIAPGPIEIVFSDVSFRYSPDRPEALSGVTFTIAAGATTAVAGPSGAGKSTIASLALRLLDPESGEISVDGRPLRGIDAREWRRHVAWVPQRPHIFNGTVLDNLRLARPEATLDDVRRALTDAHADAFVGQLPQGLHTAVGELGGRLSGGQAQRLALARAFLRDAPFVVLDEPTAHLDLEHESLVADSLKRLSAGRTVLVIAHRLTTLATADHVVVLQGGRVVAQGRHAALLGQGGVYSRLVPRDGADDAR